MYKKCFLYFSIHLKKFWFSQVHAMSLPDRSIVKLERSNNSSIWLKAPSSRVFNLLSERSNNLSFDTVLISTIQLDILLLLVLRQRKCFVFFRSSFGRDDILLKDKSNTSRFVKVSSNSPFVSSSKSLLISLWDKFKYLICWPSIDLNIWVQKLFEISNVSI